MHRTRARHARRAAARAATAVALAAVTALALVTAGTATADVPDPSASAPSSSAPASSEPTAQPTSQPTTGPTTESTPGPTTEPLPHEVTVPVPAPTQTNAWGEPCPTVYGTWTRGCPEVPNPDPGCVQGRGLCPGEHAGWAMVDEHGNSVGVIVCTPEVCGANAPLVPGNPGFGGGFWGGYRVVLQSAQDMDEARRSPNGVGNVAGYGPGARYSFETGTWTLQAGNGQVYEITRDYPNGDNLRLLFDPEQPSSITLPDGTQVPVDPTEAERLREALIVQALPTAEQVSELAGYPISEGQAARRTTLVTGAVDAADANRFGQAADSAVRLTWMYAWGAVGTLPEAQREAVRDDLRTTSIDGRTERQLVTDARVVARADLVASLAAVRPSATPEQVASCANALLTGRARAARAACA